MEAVSPPAPGVAALLTLTPADAAAAAEWVAGVPPPALRAAARAAVEHFRVQVPLPALVAATVGECAAAPGFDELPAPAAVEARRMLRAPARAAVLAEAEELMAKYLVHMVGATALRSTVVARAGWHSALLASTWDHLDTSGTGKAVTCTASVHRVTCPTGEVQDMCVATVAGTPLQEEAPGGWCAIQ